jgi:1-acyl-sn-glycerol-3-phosphate acyltransferase
VIAVARICVIFCYFCCVCIFGCIFCLFRPFHPNNVYWVSMAFGKVTGLLGVDIEIRVPDSVKDLGCCVYVANHQNALDLFLIASGVQPYTATVGKKSLKWIPLFGQLYWLSGNILIDRNNKGKAFNTIAQTVKKIKERKISVWMFAEGTRNYGKGLLPFKTGAFHTAVQAKVPIVPLCLSATTGLVKLNRWDNGKIIIEIMEPMAVSAPDGNREDKESVRSMANQVHQLMKQKIADLDQEVAKGARNKT